MQKLKFYFGVSSILLFLAGCFVITIHPLFEKKDLIKNPALAGTWYSRNNSGKTCDFWKFEEADSNFSYKLSVWHVDSSDIKHNDTAEFEIRLGKLGNNMFFDIYPIDYNKDKNSMTPVHLIPGHSISKIKVDKDSLMISFLNYKWLQDMLMKKKIKLKYEYQESSQIIILTNYADELQKFVMEFANDTSAFPKPDVELGRVK